MPASDPREAARPALHPVLKLAVTCAAGLGGAALLYAGLGALSNSGPQMAVGRGEAGTSLTPIASQAQAAEVAMHVLAPPLPKGQGAPAPDATFLDARGKPVRLADFKGRVVVLNMWATWCAPCRKEMPSLAALQKAYVGRPVQVVALSVDQAAATDKARAFIAQNAPLAFYQDPTLSFPFKLKPPVQGFPTTLVYDKAGHLRTEVASDVDWTGPRPRKILDKLAAE